MSGFEALGVLASIAQLLDYSLKLSSLVREVYSRVRDAPERVATHTAQIRQLVDTARLIGRSSDLQRPLVGIHIKATLAEAESLLRILERMVQDYTKGTSKKRIWKALIGAGERRMLTSFDRLEKEKSALILCIGFIHTETLGTIRDGVDELIPKMANIDQSVTALGKSWTKQRNSHSILDQPPNEDLETPTYGTPMYQKDIEVVLREHRLPSTVPTNNNIPLGDLGRNSINNPISSDDSFMVLGGYEEEKSRDLYVMMAVSKDNSLMVGGHWGGTGQHRHVQPKSSGQSVMILGNVKGSATVEEIDQKFQRLQKPVKRTS